MDESGHDGKIIVGWREYVDLPDWGIEGVLAKVDTGARTSSLHVRDIQDLPGNRVRFEVVLSRKATAAAIPVEAKLVRMARITPSSGVRQRRRVIRTTMRLGGVDRTVEISLVCRKAMLCRMLVGRLALEDGFLVDPAQRYVFGTRRRKGRSRR